MNYLESAVEEVREWSKAWWLVALVGLLSIAAGVIVLLWPGISLVTLAFIAGIFVLVDGVLAIVTTFGADTENRGLWALFGALSVIVGLLLVRYPISGVVAVALLLGFWLVAMGIVRLVNVVQTTGNKFLYLLVAAVEIAVGVFIVAKPAIGVATLALIVAIAFIVRGTGLVFGAWTVHDITTHAPGHGQPASSA